MWRYIKSAFNARPLGMLIPPNWVGLAAFALLGLFLNPGFFVIGAGLELAYLFLLVSNKRFQRVVDARDSHDKSRDEAERIKRMLVELERDDQDRYRALEIRCQTILREQQHAGAENLPDQAHGLGRLMWIYLRLLTTRQALLRVLREAGSVDEPLDHRIGRLQRTLKSADVDENLRRSLSGQVEILQQRVERRAEAKQKLVFLEAELTRIEQQVELIREQAVVTRDPTAMSQRIDEVSATLGGTNQWIADQQRLYGSVEDLLADPPPVAIPTSG
jgi:hypothetical protein